MKPTQNYFGGLSTNTLDKTADVHSMMFKTTTALKETKATKITIRQNPLASAKKCTESIGFWGESSVD